MVRFTAILSIVLCFLSCGDEYPGYTKSGDLHYKLDSIAVFPSTINECSGFTLEGEQLIIINDGFHGPDLHYYNIEDGASFAVNIKGAFNNDWEAIMMTDDEIIVGDVGNNYGKRQTLRLYHIDRISHELLHINIFNYPNQTFEESSTHNFDAEAIAYINGQVCIFTKNRGNTKTNLYSAPLYSENFTLRDSIEVPWRVTDAFHDDATGNLFLLCNQMIDGLHMSAIEIVSMTEGFGHNHLASIPLPIHDKLEAITLKAGTTFYLGSEIESGGRGMLYEIDIIGL